MSSNNDSNLRQRKPDISSSSSKKTPTNVPLEDQTSRVISLLDILRIVLTLLAAVLATSYYTTSGSSLIFNYPRPWFTKPARIQAYFSGPIQLTLEQLALYNGTDPNLPIYLAINGTIFDVSVGRHTYGPGGSYHAFAGHDATRGYVTGCFMQDRTGDLRGAEETYLAIEDDENEVISSGERKIRAEKERRAAKARVRAEVDNWVGFYKRSQKYFEVGEVVGVNEYTGPAPTLCPEAEKGRPKRSNINKKIKEKENKSPGKPVQ